MGAEIASGTGETADKSQIKVKRYSPDTQPHPPDNVGPLGTYYPHAMHSLAYGKGYPGSIGANQTPVLTTLRSRGRVGFF